MPKHGGGTGRGTNVHRLMCVVTCVGVCGRVFSVCVGACVHVKCTMCAYAVFGVFRGCVCARLCVWIEGPHRILSVVARFVSHLPFSQLLYPSGPQPSSAPLSQQCSTAALYTHTHTHTHTHAHLRTHRHPHFFLLLLFAHPHCASFLSSSASLCHSLLAPIWRLQLLYRRFSLSLSLSPFAPPPPLRAR